MPSSHRAGWIGGFHAANQRSLRDTGGEDEIAQPHVSVQGSEQRDADDVGRAERERFRCRGFMLGGSR